MLVVRRPSAVVAASFQGSVGGPPVAGGGGGGAPTLVSAEILDAAATQIKFTYSAPLDGSSTPANIRYWTVDTGRKKWASGVSVNGPAGTVTVTFDRSFIWGEVVQAYYMPPSTGFIRGASGGSAVAAILGGAVTNSIVAAGTEYFVDPVAGNNANAGTSEGAPWANPPGTRTASNSGYISAAWGSIDGTPKVAAGSRIYFKGGSSFTSADCGRFAVNTTYYENGTAKNPTMFIVSSTWGSGAVTQNISGMTTTDSSWAVNVVQTMSNFVVSGASAGQPWRTINGSSSANAWGFYGASSGSRLSGNGMRWCELTGHSLGGIEFTWQTQPWTRDCLIHDIGTTAGTGILFGQLNDVGSDGARIAGGEIYNIATSAGASAIAHGIQSTQGSTVASPCVIYGVNIHHCGRDCIDVGLASGGETHFRIINSWIHDTDEDGIGNNNQEPEPLGAVTVVAINNRITGNGNFTQAYNGVQLYLIHNTISGNGRNFFLYTETGDVLTGIYARGNLFAAGSAGIAQVDTYTLSGGPPCYSFDSDGNLWTNAGGSLTNNDFLNGDDNAAANYNNWDHFGANDVRTVTAQAFVNAGAGDYHLTTGTGTAQGVAVDVTSTYPDATFDADGVERVYATKAYAGAYEYAA